MKPTVSKSEVIAAIESTPARGTWSRAVREDACTLVEGVEVDALPIDPGALRCLLLNGARDWYEYSYGGSALIYNEDIAAHYFNKSEHARWSRPRHDSGMAFNGEEILEMQGRALAQAFRIVLRCVSRIACA